ncbi:MAG: hypothetical protein WCJ19_00485 [bacterium]
MFTILTLITIISWVFFSIWREVTSSHIPDDVNENITAIEKTFDIDYISNIYKNKKAQ